MSIGGGAPVLYGASIHLGPGWTRTYAYARQVGESLSPQHRLKCAAPYISFSSSVKNASKTSQTGEERAADPLLINPSSLPAQFNRAHHELIQRQAARIATPHLTPPKPHSGQFVSIPTYTGTRKMRGARTSAGCVFPVLTTKYTRSGFSPYMWWTHSPAISVAAP